MAKLKRNEIRLIEDAVSFPKGRGYVLDFSDKTIAEFFEDEFNVDFDDPNISGEGSKRVRLINYLERANAFKAVKVLRALWDHREGVIMRHGNHLNPNAERILEKKFFQIIQNLELCESTPSSDGVDLYEQDRTLEELIADIERSLGANKPEAALDHLHTYCMNKITHLLKSRNIRCAENEPLHSRFGKYRKCAQSEFQLTEFTDRALSVTISLFESFNHIRNNHSLAHPNPILEPAEARYVFEIICTSLRFIRSVEAGRYSS